MQVELKFRQFFFSKSSFYDVFEHIQGGGGYRPPPKTGVKWPPTMFSLQKFIIFMAGQIGLWGPLPKPKKCLSMMTFQLEMSGFWRPFKTENFMPFRGRSIRRPSGHQKSCFFFENLHFTMCFGTFMFLRLSVHIKNGNENCVSLGTSYKNQWISCSYSFRNIYLLGLLTFRAKLTKWNGLVTFHTQT